MPNDSNWFAPMNSANYMSSLQNIPAPRLEQYKPGMSNIQPIPLNQQYKYNEPENKQSGINIPYNFINQMVTGIDTMSNMFGNSKFNAQKRFNNQNVPYQQNKDLYSTNQDFYGVPYAQEGGSIDDLRARYESSKTLSNVAMMDNNYDFANYMSKKSSNLYDEIKSLEQITHDESLRQDILSSLPKQSQQEQYSDPYQRRAVSDFDESGYDDNSEGYISPNGIPSPNIGFNIRPGNMYQTSKQLEGMSYQMGAKGSNNKIDCSGAVCKIVGVPTMTSEDVTTHGKNFRRFQGPQDLKEGTVLGFDFGPKKHDRGRKLGIDHTGVIVKNPNTNQLEYKESVSGTGFRTLSIPDFLKKYPNKAKDIFVSQYQKGGYTNNSDWEII